MPTIPADIRISVRIGGEIDMDLCKKMLEINTKSLSVNGFVYLAGCGDLTKIGYSSDPLNRVKNIKHQSKLSMEPFIVSVIPSSDGRMVESLLHKQYISKRVFGEWFYLSDLDISEIKTLVPDGFDYKQEVKSFIERRLAHDKCPF